MHQDQMVLSWIVALVSESALPQIIGAETASVAWDKLISIYAKASKSKICDLKNQLVTLCHGSNSIETYVQKAKGLVDRMILLSLLRVVLVHYIDHLQFTRPWMLHKLKFLLILYMGYC